MKTKMKMKKIKTICFKKLLITLLCTGVTANTPAQFIQKRIFERKEPVTRETTLEIGNKYGTVEITIWRKDSVSIRAEIEAQAPNQERTDKMIKGINIEISSTKYLIRAQTEFENTLNMILENFKGMTNKLIPYDSKVAINYYIQAPPYLNLRVDNRYGDIFIDQNSGDVNISLSNGSLKANNIAKASQLKVSFGDVVIKNTGDCNIDASFSEFIIDEAGYLRFKSISSRYDIKQVKTLFLESRRDKFYIGTLGSITGESYFTQLRVNRLLTDAELTVRYGDTYFETIENRFQSVSITSNYNDLTLNFEPSASYNLDIRHASTSVMLPAENADIKKDTLNEEKKEYIFTGTVGKNPGNRKVKINATRGSILIR